MSERDSQRGSYLGIAYSNDEIKKFINSTGVKAEYYSDEELIKLVANLLNEEKIVGLFNGRMEFGPRALGSRSIIGDARSPNMQATMNIKIKFREGFRPFAPSVLADRVSDWFELDEESPYMLLVAGVKEDKLRKMNKEEEQLWGIEKLNVVRSEIPAVTHVDYSARIQTVNSDDNPFYYNLINEFYKLTGCPVIVNTSFNVRGEPIVCSPKDAYTCFMRTHIDYLVLGNYMLDKKAQTEMEADVEWEKEYQLD